MIPRSVVDHELRNLQSATLAEPLKYTEVEVEDFTFAFANGGAYTVTLFPDDQVTTIGEGENERFFVSKLLERVEIYKRHVMMITRVERIQKVFEKPFKPSVQDGAYLQAETAHPTPAP